ncbi:MAG: stage III sporulation protein AB [Lachnospiraceae bacterium]|nr:stage III sporulation protein AB [Lachnospiraceae bacterium]
MCKILGLLCMFLGCSFLGIGRAMEYKEREENTRYLVYILDCLVSQIVYQQSTLEDCMYELSGKVREPYKGCFLDIYTKIRENTQVTPLEIMEQELRALLERLHINKDIAKLFVECFTCCGFQDTGGMEKVLKGIKERLLEFNAGALEESRKQSRLAVYLGMFGGMFCVILCL